MKALRSISLKGYNGLKLGLNHFDYLEQILTGSASRQSEDYSCCIPQNQVSRHPVWLWNSFSNIFTRGGVVKRENKYSDHGRFNVCWSIPRF